MKQHMTTMVSVSGVGNTKDQAFGNALGQIQKTLMKSNDEMMIRIEPLDVEVIEAVEETYTERFLIFFFPRKRSKFKVVLNVTVEMVVLEINKVPFEVVTNKQYPNLKMKANRLQR